MDDLIRKVIEELKPRFVGMEKYMTNKSEFQSFCHSQISGGIGMKIRNEYGLWQNSEVYHAIAKQEQLVEPDSMSNYLIGVIFDEMNPKDNIKE